MLEKNYTPKDFEEKIYADWEIGRASCRERVLDRV